MSGPGRIRVGIGGWNYPEWRGSFYPEGLPQTQELRHASRHLTSLEVNGTFYSTFKPATFRKWADEVPADFVFSLKAPRFAVNRRELRTAGDAIARFVESGLAELGEKLGPILWQLAPTKRFDAADLAGFLALLPARVGRRPLRHVLEVRHSVATVVTDSEEYPQFGEAAGPFVYARLVRCESRMRLGYAPKALDAWAATARSWAAGRAPAEPQRPLPGDGEAPSPARDVFLYFINGAKEKAPAAAEALIARLA